jgi:hypothetical protein
MVILKSYEQYKLPESVLTRQHYELYDGYRDSHHRQQLHMYCVYYFAVYMTLGHTRL